MPLLLTEKKFHDDLKVNKCLAIFAPLEGGYETRLLKECALKVLKLISPQQGLGDLKFPTKITWN